MEKKKVDTRVGAARGGRPKLELDVEQIRRLGHIHCTYKEIALIMRCTEATIHDRFSNIVEEARADGKMSLRRAQFKKALEGNPALLMFLGTHVLNQKDAKEEQVRTSADEILSYLRGRIKSEEEGTFKGRKGAPKKSGK